MNQRQTSIVFFNTLPNKSSCLCTSTLYILLLLLCSGLKDKTRRSLADLLHLDFKLSEEHLEYIQKISKNKHFKQANILYYFYKHDVEEWYNNIISSKYNMIFENFKSYHYDFTSKVNTNIKSCIDEKIGNVFNSEIKDNVFAISGQCFDIKFERGFYSTEKYVFNFGESKKTVNFMVDYFRTVLYGSDNYKSWITLKTVDGYLVHFILSKYDINAGIKRLYENYDLNETKEVVVGRILIPKFTIKSKYSLKKHAKQLGIERLFQSSSDTDDLMKNMLLGDVYCSTTIDICPNGTKNFNIYKVKHDITEMIFNTEFLMVIEDENRYILDVCKFIDDKYFQQEMGYGHDF